MGHTDNYLNIVRGKIAADDTVLKEARERLALVRDIAMDFPGALRTYASGSLAQYTVNHPVTDGDGGLVLNRVDYPELGPEGSGETPNDVADELCALLGPEIRQTYPNACCGKSKRGPKITFGEPINGQDPSVDLVVALTRREGSGLWIPNLDMRRWEASDPEAHVALLNGDPLSLRRTRRRAIRLLKAWNKQWTIPAFSSFHLSALALEHITAGMGLAAAMHAVFDGAATFLATGRNTPDPAGVSTPLKLVNGISREVAVQRLRAAATAMADAIEHDDDEHAVQSALHRVFRDYVDAPAEDKLAAAVAALRTRRPVSTVALGLGGTAAAVTRRPAHRHPAWFDRPAHRLRLIAELQAVGAGVTVVRPSQSRRGGFAVRVVLTPAGLQPQRVTIEFGPNTPDTPAIYVPGPRSPHRYDDGSLCIWYLYDPPEERWTWHDGGAALAGHICAHLIREAWWRETGEWVGDEAAHDLPLTQPSDPPTARRTSC